MNTSWLTFLEPFAIEDDLKAKTYEQANAEQRQTLKNAIAYHALQGENPSAESHFSAHKTKGFWQRKHSAASPMAFILCGEEYSSPARLIASVMPALLAGVTQCIFLRIGQGAPPPALLLALELLGLEEAYNLPDIPTSIQFLRALALGGTADGTSHAPPHNQRLLLLHPQKSLAALMPLVEDMHMPHFEESRPPRIFMPPTIGDGMKKSVLFAQPDAVIMPSLFDFAHAYYGMEKPSLNVLEQALSQGTASYEQYLTEGMEACWHMRGLNQEFFLNHCIMAGSLFTAE